MQQREQRETKAIGNLQVDRKESWDLQFLFGFQPVGRVILHRPILNYRSYFTKFDSTFTHFEQDIHEALHFLA